MGRGGSPWQPALAPPLLLGIHLHMRVAVPQSAAPAARDARLHAMHPCWQHHDGLWRLPLLFCCMQGPSRSPGRAQDTYRSALSRDGRSLRVPTHREPLLPSQMARTRA